MYEEFDYFQSLLCHKEIYIYAHVYVDPHTHTGSRIYKWLQNLPCIFNVPENWFLGFKYKVDALHNFNPKITKTTKQNIPKTTTKTTKILLFSPWNNSSSSKCQIKAETEFLINRKFVVSLPRMQNKIFCGVWEM